MAIQISENDVTVKYTEQAGKGQLAAECSIDASAGGVSKIYCVNGGCGVKSVQAQDKAVRVVLEVTTRVVYADASGAVASADYVTEITEAVAAPEVAEGMSVSAKACLSDIQSEAVGSSIKVQAVIDLEFESECEYTASLVEDVQGAVTRVAECERTELKGGGSDSFTVTEEYESGCAIGKILDYGAQVFFTALRAEEGSVYAEGEVWIRLVYDDNGICSKQFTHPFAEQLMISGACADDVVTANAQIKSFSILLTGSAEENVVQMEVAVEAEVKLFEKVKTQVITDVFSPLAELEVSRTEKEYYAPEGMRFACKRVCGTAEVQEEGVRRILASVPSFGGLTNLYCSGGRLVAEGVMNVCQIYEKDDGAVGSLCVEIPYSFSADAKEAEDGCLAKAVAAVTDVVSRLRREGEIEVCANVALQAVIYRKNALSGVAHIEVGQEREADDAGISVYVVEEGETLWDAAKALNISERDIAAQNPGAEKGIKAGDKLIVFRCVC